VADDVIAGMQATGELGGAATVLRFADIRESDAEPLGLTADVVAEGGAPDLAILMKGDFQIAKGGDSPYLLIVVDLNSGGAFLTMGSPDRDYLERMLPPP